MQTQPQQFQILNKTCGFFSHYSFLFFSTLAERKKNGHAKTLRGFFQADRPCSLCSRCSNCTTRMKKIKLLPWLTCLFCDLWLCREAAQRLRVPTQESLRESLSIPLPRQAHDLNVKSQPCQPPTHPPPDPPSSHPASPSTDGAVRCSAGALKRGKISGLLQ